MPETVPPGKISLMTQELNNTWRYNDITFTSSEVGSTAAVTGSKICTAALLTQCGKMDRLELLCYSVRDNYCNDIELEHDSICRRSSWESVNE